MAKCISLFAVVAAFCFTAEAATRTDFNRALGRQYNDLRLEAITGLQQEQLVGLSIRAGQTEKSCVVNTGGPAIVQVKAEIQRQREALIARPDSDFEPLNPQQLEDLIRKNMVEPVYKLLKEKAQLIHDCHKNLPPQ